MVHSDEPVPVAALLGPMRTALDPPGPRQLPSPFSVPVPETAAVEQPAPVPAT